MGCNQQEKQLTFAEIGKRLGISEPRVHSIHKNLLHRLKVELSNDSFIKQAYLYKSKER